MISCTLIIARSPVNQSGVLSLQLDGISIILKTTRAILTPNQAEHETTRLMKRPIVHSQRTRLACYSILALCAALQVSAGPPIPTGVAPKGVANQKEASPTYIPQFLTGFEADELAAEPENEVSWMVFNNTSPLPNASPWAMSVYYENAGDVNDRYARVIDDPTNEPGDPPNKVLKYWLKNATIDAGYLQHTKGRIQTGFPAQLVDASEVYARQRLYIHEDANLLMSYPRDADHWWIGVILQELWMGAAWEGHPNPSRINLSMFPYNGEMHLQLLCESTPNGPTLWSEANLQFDLPIGQWITIETGYKMGDASSGRMVVVITNEQSGQRRVVFDVHDRTYNPDADLPGGTGPVPLTHWNPQKLYTSDNVIDFIRDSGGVLQVYFDDFGFSDHWPSDWDVEP